MENFQCHRLLFILALKINKLLLLLLLYKIEYYALWNAEKGDELVLTGSWKFEIKN